MNMLSFLNDKDTDTESSKDSKAWTVTKDTCVISEKKKDYTIHPLFISTLQGRRHFLWTHLFSPGHFACLGYFHFGKHQLITLHQSFFSSPTQLHYSCPVHFKIAIHIRCCEVEAVFFNLVGRNVCFFGQNIDHFRNLNCHNSVFWMQLLTQKENKEANEPHQHCSVDGDSAAPFRDTHSQDSGFSRTHRSWGWEESETALTKVTRLAEKERWRSHLSHDLHVPAMCGYVLELIRELLV